MAVLGAQPRALFEFEDDAIFNTAASGNVSVFENAMRVRQIAVNAVHESIVEERIIRANRTRPQQLDLSELVPGVTEVEMLREDSESKGWRGPADLFKIDPNDGTAIVEHQGNPYKPSMRRVRRFRGSYFAQDLDDDIHYAVKWLKAMAQNATPQGAAPASSSISTTRT